MTVVPTSKSLPLEFSEQLERLSPRLGLLASRTLWFDAVGSTNDIAVALAERDEPEGTVIVADEQLAGRGRLGRSWVSPAGAGLYVSVIVRPLAPTPILTLAAGVALARGIEAASGLLVDLKWPNDVYVGSRKLAGILAEGGSSPQRGHFVVIGFGVNISSAAYPPDIAIRATALETELGRSADRGLVLAESLSALAETSSDVSAGRHSIVLQEWRRLAHRTLGRTVEWDDVGGSRSGTARDIDETGALVVEVSNGMVRVVGGEVRWR